MATTKKKREEVQRVVGVVEKPTCKTCPCWNQEDCPHNPLEVGLFAKERMGAEDYCPEHPDFRVWFNSLPWNTLRGQDAKAR